MTLHQRPYVKQTFLKFPSYLVHTCEVVLQSFRADGHAISSRHLGWCGAGSFDPPVLFSLYVNDMLSTLDPIDLALYAEDSVNIARSRKAILLFRYLNSNLNHNQRWLSGWRIAINVSNSTVIIFRRTRLRFIPPRTLILLEEPNPMGRHNSLFGSDIRHSPGRLTSITSG